MSISCHSTSTFTARDYPLALILAVPLSLIFLNTAHSQAGEIPTYISALQDFEVAGLAGEKGPIDGQLSIEDVTPDEWLTNDPSTIGLRAVIIAWSGGAKGTGSKLFVHGGGHNDSANNGLYTFDFSGTDRPLGWDTDVVISSVAAVRAKEPLYGDNKPAAVHTYDGLIYSGHNNSVYRFGGSRYNDGSMTSTSFKFDVSAKEWTTIASYPNNGGGAKTIYDPISRNIFVTMNDSLIGYFFRTLTDTWSAGKTYSGSGFPFNSTAAWDPSRSRGIVVGDNATNLLSINFSSETVNVANFDPTGDTEIFGISGVSVFYDPFVDVYWLFGGNTSSPGWSSIYEMNADGPPWIVRSHTLSGESIVRADGMLGSWGRFVFMDKWRAIGLVASETSSVYVIKLPSGSTSVPKPPSALGTN